MFPHSDSIFSYRAPEVLLQSSSYTPAIGYTDLLRFSRPVNIQFSGHFCLRIEMEFPHQLNPHCHCHSARFSIHLQEFHRTLLCSLTSWSALCWPCPRLSNMASTFELGFNNGESVNNMYFSSLFWVRIVLA